MPPAPGRPSGPAVIDPGPARPAPADAVRRGLRWLTPAVVFCATALAGALIAWQSELHRVAERKAAAQALATHFAQALSQRIDQGASATYALAAVLSRGGGRFDDFDGMARQALGLYPGISALQLAPGAIVRESVPRQGHEKAIGMDLLADPQRNREALLAIRERRLTLAGPFELRQGGLAVVGRLPVFLPDPDGRDHFWGFTIAVMRMHALLESARIGALESSGFRYELWRVAPDGVTRAVIARSRVPASDDLLVQPVPVPNGRWFLGVSPATGWHDPGRLLFEGAVGLVLAALLTVLARNQLRGRELLELEVQARTAALADSDHRLRLALEGSRAALLDWHLPADRLVLSERWSILRGGAPVVTECSLENFLALVHADDRPNLEASLHAVRTGQPRGCDTEHRVRGESGDWLWMRTQIGSVQRTDDGGARRLTGTVSDITARKEAELAVERSEARYRHLFEANPLPAWIHDSASLELLAVNDAAVALFGHPREALLGRTLTELRAPPSEAPGPGGGPDDVFRTRDGRAVEVETHSEHIAVGGRRARFVFAQDVTARRRAAAELVAAKEAAEAGSRAKSRFLAMMSHEIRTPLNGLLGMTDLLLHGDLDEGQRRLARTAHESGQSLLAVVSDVLDFSKIEAGRLELVEADFDACEVVDDVAALFAHSAAEKRLALDTDLAAWPRGTRLRGDAGRLRQVLSNLVGNALKFTQTGGIRVTVRPLTVGAPAVRLRFEVIDSGIGIEPAMQDQVFEAFTQARGGIDRRHGGTGLGLAICREIVSLMGGVVGLESHPGRGSIFWFEIPFARAEVPAAADATADPATAKAGPSPSSPPATVLVVDDNPVNRVVASSMLQALGHEVEAVESGREAIEAVRRRHYDLVLMDCEMPDMDGYAATRAVRALERFGTLEGPRLRIVALTAHAFEDTRAACLDAGMDGYLTKPVTRGALAQAVADCRAAA